MTDGTGSSTPTGPRKASSSDPTSTTPSWRAAPAAVVEDVVTSL